MNLDFAHVLQQVTLQVTPQVTSQVTPSVRLMSLQTRSRSDKNAEIVLRKLGQFVYIFEVVFCRVMEKNGENTKNDKYFQKN